MLPAGIEHRLSAYKPGALSAWSNRRGQKDVRIAVQVTCLVFLKATFLENCWKANRITLTYYKFGDDLLLEVIWNQTKFRTL